MLGGSRRPTPRKVISPSPTGPVGPDLVDKTGFEPASPAAPLWTAVPGSRLALAVAAERTPTRSPYP